MHFQAKRRRQLILTMRRLRRKSVLYKYNIIFAKLCKFHFVRVCSKNDALHRAYKGHKDVKESDIKKMYRDTRILWKWLICNYITYQMTAM